MAKSALFSRSVIIYKNLRQPETLPKFSTRKAQEQTILRDLAAGWSAIKGSRPNNLKKMGHRPGDEIELALGHLVPLIERIKRENPPCTEVSELRTMFIA